MNETVQGLSRLETPGIGLGRRGRWLDLSQPPQSGMPRMDFFPAPCREQVIRRPEEPLDVTAIQVVCQVKTPVDA